MNEWWGCRENGGGEGGRVGRGGGGEHRIIIMGGEGGKVGKGGGEQRIIIIIGTIIVR